MRKRSHLYKDNNMLQRIKHINISASIVIEIGIQRMDAVNIIIYH